MSRKPALFTVTALALCMMTYWIKADDTAGADPDVGRDLELLQQNPTIWHWRRVDEGRGEAGEGTVGNRLSE